MLRTNLVGADPGRRFLPRPKGLPGGLPAVVYPALDKDRRPVYFQARFLDPLNGRSKYDNPARRWASNPRLAWIEPPAALERDALVVTEGIADGLIAAQSGFGAVGVLGSQYPDERVGDAIVQNADGRKVIICFDADDAGRQGTERLADLIEQRNLGRPDVVEPPTGMDLTDWANQDPNWADLIDPPLNPKLPRQQPEPVGDLGLSLHLPE